MLLLLEHLIKMHENQRDMNFNWTHTDKTFKSKFDLVKKRCFYGQLKVAGFVEKIIQKSSAPNTHMDRHMIMRFYSIVEEDAI